MEDYKLSLMCGTDIPIPQCSLTIHQPKIWEISFLGEKNFFVAIQCLTINKNMISEDNSALELMDNFHIFMTIMSEQETRDKKEAVIQLFSILVPNGKVIFTPRSMLINVEGQQSVIDESNFDIFQEVLKEVFCFTNGPMDKSNFNPVNEQARQIAEKLMRGRERVAAQKGQNSNSSMFSQYVSILTVGLNAMSLESCLNLTMFQLLDLMERYSLYTNWEMDIRSRLAGGKPDNQPDNWMKNIH